MDTQSSSGSPHARSGGYPAIQPGSFPSESSGIGGLGFLQVLGVLRRRWWLVVLFAAFSLAAAWRLVPQDRVVYSAAAAVRFDDARSSLSGALTQEADNVKAPDFLTAQIHVLQSRTLVGEVVDSTAFRLATAPELPMYLVQDISVSPEAAPDTLVLSFSEHAFTVQVGGSELGAEYGVPLEVGGVRFTLAGRPGEESSYLVVRPREQAIDRLLLGLVAVQRVSGGQRQQGTPIIDISYSDADPGRAQRVVNALAHSFQAHNMRGVRERSRRRKEFIEQLLTQSEADLARAEAALIAFRSQGRPYSSRDRLLAEQSSLIGIETRRTELDSERSMYRALLERVAQSDVLSDHEVRTLMAAPGIAASPFVSSVFARLVGYQTERERLVAGGKAAAHPDVEHLTTLIASTKGALVEAVRSHIASLDLRIASLDDLRSRSSGTIRELPAAEAEEIHLTQEVEIARRMAVGLREEHQRARINEAAQVGQVEILDLARFAAPVVSGNRKRNLLFGLIFGLLLGGGSALLLEATNSSIRRREELDELLMVPGLGVIPALADGGQPRRRWLPVRLRQRTGLAGENRGEPPATPDFAALGSEAYRILRTNLLFSQAGERPKTLAVTSALSGEGKTTTTANLGVSLARQGMKVLLIDADLRRPRLHRLFGVEQSPGLSELLLGGAVAADALRPTSVEGLHLLPRGAFDERALEAIGSERMKHLLVVFSQHFDFVLLDTSPVLVAADTTALSVAVDGVLLVVRAGRTQRDAARQTIQQLHAVGARVVGSVLNDPDSTAKEYGNYYYREYYPAEP